MVVTRPSTPIASTKVTKGAWIVSKISTLVAKAGLGKLTSSHSVASVPKSGVHELALETQAGATLLAPVARIADQSAESYSLEAEAELAHCITDGASGVVRGGEGIGDG